MKSSDPEPNVSECLRHAALRVSTLDEPAGWTEGRAVCLLSGTGICFALPGFRWEQAAERADRFCAQHPAVKNGTAEGSWPEGC